MMPVPWKLWEGQVLDLTFPLRRYLGGTDQSAVYLTQYGDPEPRNAAIKLVLAPSMDDELLAQWDRAAKLSHPNLLRLWRRGSCHVNGMALYYVVTEYAEENLADVLAERPLTPVEVRDMLTPLLDGLEYIHGEGLVHGHVKPANIMAVGDQLKLSVDGISRVGDLTVLPSRPSPYDPPEFAESGCSPIGDVWSFGVTLVESLTQRRPQPGGPKQEPALPTTLPDEFLPLVRACLRPDARRRAPLSDILSLLQRPGQKLPVRPEPEPPAAKRKWPSLLIVTAATLALAAILATPRLLRQAAPEGAQQSLVQNAAAQEVVAKPEVHPAVETVAPVEVPPPVTPAPVPTPAPVAAPAPTRAPKLESLPDQVVHQVLPTVTDSARRTIRGKVKISVRATVDAAGHVSSAEVESQNSRYFANLSLQAAKQWAFQPSDSAREWLLQFEITTKDTEVRPQRVGR